MKTNLRTTKRRTRRGFRMWLLLAAYAMLAALGWLRMVTSLSNWYWLENVAGVQPGPLYLAISGAAWGLVGLAALVWVYARWRRYRLAGMSAVVFYALTYWLDRLFVARTGTLDSNLMFAIGFTLLCLAAAAGVLFRPVGSITRHDDRDGGE